MSVDAMDADAPIDSFGGLLRWYRERAGFSRNALALTAGVNPSYVTRIELGERGAPRIGITEALARPLKLSHDELDRLFVAAEKRPPSVERMGGWHPVLSAVTNVMNDEEISSDRRADFATIIQTIARNWR